MKSFELYLLESLLDPRSRTTESINEKVARFLPYCQEKLDIKKLPIIWLDQDLPRVQEMRSMAYYSPSEKLVWCHHGGRLAADVLRSVAHELVHHQQLERGEVLEGHLGAEHPLEQEANAKAGILLRDWGKLDATIYE